MPLRYAALGFLSRWRPARISRRDGSTSAMELSPPECSSQYYHKHVPHILVIVDSFGDIPMISSRTGRAVSATTARVDQFALIGISYGQAWE